MTVKQTLDFLRKTKQNIKLSKYRQRFDTLADEIDQNLVNTQVVKGKIDESQKTLVQLVTIRPDGSTDFAIMPQANRFDDSVSSTPRSAEAIAFSKIITASSAFASQIPDGVTYSVNKIKSRAYYEQWKYSWSQPEANGINTLQTTGQNLCTYGWAAWRVYPKTEIIYKTIKGKKIPKIVFDDLFREPLHPKRTWFGLGYRPDINDGRVEMYWEIDVTKEKYAEMKRNYNKRSLKGDDNGGVTTEATQEDAQKQETHVTICFYENPHANRLVIASEATVFYDDEIPNDEIYGSVVVGNCFIKDPDDPYGVGFYELMRGNQAIYNYVNSLNTEQVEAEVAPLLFASGITGNGDLTYKRSSYKLNQLPVGSKIDKINTTGNVTLSINYANQQKQDIEDNTGINNIVSGASSDQTLGGTVILKEAALSRLMKPRNSLKQMIETDACISFSWFEQEQGEFRQFAFVTEEEADEFQRMNPMFHVEEDENELDELGVPMSNNVLASKKIPLSFDYSMDDLQDSDYENQNIQELGSSSVLVSRATIAKNMKTLDQPNKIGYDKVLLKIDSNSMLIPSVEIEKQVAMQLFPIIQNSITMIYQMARQDPELAKTQLVALKKFIEVQRQNIYDYIPKSQYDMITKGGMTPTPADAVMAALEGGATQSDGTSVLQPQSPEEMGSTQNPLMASTQASIGKAAAGPM